jgi:hypothetical protein
MQTKVRQGCGGVPRPVFRRMRPGSTRERPDGTRIASRDVVGISGVIPGGVR